MRTDAPNTAPRPGRGRAREALLDAAVDVIREHGLHATTVDDLCAAAGVTKGAFFHHFATKDELAVEAARHWTSTTGALFAEAGYHDLADPVDRVLGYLDLRAALVEGTTAQYTCLVGTMVQEAFDTHPDVRDACAESIFGHAATLEDDISAALEQCGNRTDDPAALARHTQAVLQGGFILAKAAADPAPAREAIGHLRRYFELLLAPGRPAPLPEAGR